MYIFISHNFHTVPSFCPFLGRCGWNTGIKGIKRRLPPDYWEKTWLSQLRCMSVSLILGNYAQSFSFLQLFLNCDEKHDLMWRKEGGDQERNHPIQGAVLQISDFSDGVDEKDGGKETICSFTGQNLCSTTVQKGRDSVNLEKEKKIDLNWALWPAFVLSRGTHPLATCFSELQIYLRDGLEPALVGLG